MNKLIIAGLLIAYTTVSFGAEPTRGLSDYQQKQLQAREEIIRRDNDFSRTGKTIRERFNAIQRAGLPIDESELEDKNRIIFDLRENDTEKPF